MQDAIIDPNDLIIIKDFTIKELDEEDYSFIGYLSTYENKDRVGDIIQKAAFHESIEQRSRVPMLSNHIRNEVIGHMILTDTDKGVLAKGVFNMDISEAKTMYSLVKHGDVTTMSVGMLPLDYEYYDEDKFMFPPKIIKKAEILEGSLTPVPANAAAEIMAVKAYEKNQKGRTKKHEKTLAEIKEEAEKIYKKILEEN